MLNGGMLVLRPSASKHRRMLAALRRSPSISPDTIAGAADQTFLSDFFNAKPKRGHKQVRWLMPLYNFGCAGSYLAAAPTDTSAVGLHPSSVQPRILHVCGGVKLDNYPLCLSGSSDRLIERAEPGAPQAQSACVCCGRGRG